MESRSYAYAYWAIVYVRTIIKTCLGWFASILQVLDMESLWIGAVVFVLAFSVILVPMRGGSMLGGGLMSDVARSRLANKRRNANKQNED